ncbi:MAG TPA: LLM class F420-dependent oxidoreductase [Acidimicrobiia bacterium]
MTQQRYGITVPFEGIPLHAHEDWFHEIADLGYTDVWSAESGGPDAFTPLTLAAAWEPRLRLGTAIVPAYTRGAATLAECVASLAQAAPGRFAFGIGTSSDVIVERWNAMSFDKPYQRVRDTVRFLKDALRGEKITHDYETFSVKGFRLGMRLEEHEIPPILIAALRPGMLRLAGREADGAIINWLSADDVKQVVPHVGQGKEIAARIFVCPSDDAKTVRSLARRLIASYLNVPVYRAFHEWLGRGPALQDMWDAWAEGDRERAVAAISDDVVDDLVVHGSAEQCRATLARYMENGVTTPAPAVIPIGVDLREAIRGLAPSAGN